MHPAEFSILLHRALEARVGRLLEIGARPDWQQDPQGIHEVRVASRRVRAVLDLLDPKIYPGFKRYRRRAKALTGILGATRELDVHLAILDSLKKHGLEATHQAALEHAQETLDRARRRTERRMLRKLENPSLHHWAGLLKVPSLPDPLGQSDVHACAWACLEPRIGGALDPIPSLSAQEDPQALHALRIKVKQLRYTLEILEPALGPETAAAQEQLRKLQTILGEHHELVGLEAVLWDLHGRLTERRRAVLCTGLLDIIGLVAEDRRARYDAFREIAPEFDSFRSALGLPTGSQS